MRETEIDQVILVYVDLKEIPIKVGSPVAFWRIQAQNLKIKKEQINRMASAFEHKDLQKAMNL